MKDTKSQNHIVVRIPPSPTGNLHVGTARTALFNFLFAKKYDGKIILRMEDTDKERNREEYEKNILEGLEWLGITYDESPVRQSERGEIYKKYLQQLLDEDKAYRTSDAEEELLASLKKRKADGENNKTSAIRFRNFNPPGRSITFRDEIRGDVSMGVEELGDFVIAKNLDTPLYHMAVVIDDFEMGVTHVIRGEDHISNTPRQILIQEALGAPRPKYAHIPLILAPDRTKLSKRHGAVSVTEYRDRGYLPEALVNYLALLGWNPGTDQEIFTMDELIEQFTLEKVQKGGAVFDIEKLNWINKEHLAKRSPEEVGKGILHFLPKMDFIHPDGAVKLLRERIHYYGEAKEIVEQGEFDYLIEDKDVKLDKSVLLQGNKLPVDNSKRHLGHILDILSNMPEAREAFTAEKTREALWEYATREGRGNVLWPLRVALTGRDKSPDPFTVAEILGKDVTIERIRKAVDAL